MRATVGLVIAIALGPGLPCGRSQSASPTLLEAAVGHVSPAPAVAAKRDDLAQGDAANAGDGSDRDRDIAARLANVAAMQKQMTSVIDGYCKAHAAMPSRLEDLAIPQMPASFLVDRVALRAGTVELHLPASELLPAGTISAVPTMRDACPGAWRCRSSDFVAISKWLPKCAYDAAPAQ